MRRARGFTLLELMLAAALGGIVIVTALGVFGAIDRADHRSRERTKRAQGMETAQRTAERALRSLIMAPSAALPIPIAPPAAGGVRPPDNPVVLDTERPRMILHEDGAQGGMMVYKDAQGVEHPFVPQRLEIVVQSAPVFAEPTGEGVVEPVMFVGTPRARHPGDDRRSARESSRERSRSGRNDRSRSGPADGTGGISDSDQGRQRPGSPVPGSAESRADARPDDAADRAGDNRPRAGDEDDTEREVPLAPGIRGVFETRFEPASRAREVPPSGGLGGEPLTERRGSWSLWWRPLPLEVEEEADLPPSEAPVSLVKNTGPVRLATGLKMCRWEMVRDDETVHELEATHWEELPAYVTLEIETDMGQWQKWMFEVGATRGQEPGTPIEGVLAGGTVEPGNGGNENGAAVTPGTPSTGGRDRAPTRGTPRTSPGATPPSSTRGRPITPARPSSVRPMSPSGGPRPVPSPAPGNQPEGGP